METVRKNPRKSITLAPEMWKWLEEKEAEEDRKRKPYGLDRFGGWLCWLGVGAGSAARLRLPLAPH